MQSGDRAHLHEAMGKMKSGIIVTQPVVDAWHTTKTSDDLSWLTLIFDPSVKDTVVLRSSGNDGWNECSCDLKDTDIAFGVCAFKMGSQRRMFFFSWVG